MHDVIVIGSGIGGLSCAGLLAKSGLDVLVLESHTIPGGAAHAFHRKGYTFDSGPSLFSGMSSMSMNPLYAVLALLDESPEFISYNEWGLLLPEGDMEARIGPGYEKDFPETIEKLRGNDAVVEWEAFRRAMYPLSKAALDMDPSRIRLGQNPLQTIPTILQSFPAVGKHLFRLRTLTGPVSSVVDRKLSDPFLRNWMDLLSMLLSGLPASETLAVEVAFMFEDWYGRHRRALDYPKGGTGALVDALLRGLKKHGGRIRLKGHVSRVLLDEAGMAYGVRLDSGEEIGARKAVVSNASIWDTANLISSSSNEDSHRLFTNEAVSTPQCRSFMHVHLGMRGEGLTSLKSHYIFVEDWSRGVDADQNVVLISIPSVLDPSLAPPGCHCIHAYTPATEPYHLWEKHLQGSEAYQALKQERSEIIWKALSRAIPDIRSRIDVELTGSPKTHQRFLRRFRGSYGPAFRAGKEIFPLPSTSIPHLYLCGDSRFPGIGLPAVAASGMITANSIMTKDAYREMTNELKQKRSVPSNQNL